MEQYVNNMETNTSSEIHHHDNTATTTSTSTSTSTSQSHLLTPLPSPDFQPAKRPTRQWAAWTRQEEESFFNALRLVGKNFEKITCRVQTKNKDQVRHYYYRLVRRINKLLAPTFSLDAKNSKDTNAAMLRWWSLLEKYSCKASKLHLKPRRFKLFIEALEHQLVKDRKKNVRKRSPPSETCCASPTTTSPTTTSPNRNKLCANDVQVVKTDGQSVERGAHRKGCITRRNLSHNISKEGSSVTKPSRPRRRSGTMSAAAMKRWEKAAIAGVSLVADAAEHLERTASQKQDYLNNGLNVLSLQAAVASSIEKQVQSPLPNDVQSNVKLKLQLFPIDESTKKALEADKHNPHLELTVGGRKKISSILEHLDRKWGSSSAACGGQLMLFPFNISRQNLFKYETWTKDSHATAAEVYSISGTPPVFRLRYGWILSSELQTAMSEEAAADANNRLPTLYTRDDQTSEMNENVDGHPHKNGFQASETPPRFPTKRVENEVDHEMREIPTSAGEWADSLTNAIVGDLLTDVSDSRMVGVSCVGARGFESSSQCLGEIPFTCDSFDAAIAAHISNHNKMSVPGQSLHSSSIWDAEETCDAFSFQRNNLLTPTDNVVQQALMDTATLAARVEMNRDGNKLQELQEKGIVEDSDDGDPMDEMETKNSEKDIGELTDIYWPDSLGPLELDAPTCKYYSEEVILSESMSGLNRLIASSLDAFQNCPFLGLDDKAPHSSSPSTFPTGGNGPQSLQA